MAPTDWGSGQPTGHPKIDEQHRTLVETVDRLDLAMREGGDRAEIERILASLKDHVESHILFEENLFRLLEQLASTDLLTSAWNRRHFDQVMEGEIHRSSRYGHPMTLILLDIDHFKRVNDTFGHAVGDQVIREVANRIRSAIRLSDSLTRWGGEEFIILMPNTGLSSAAMLAERIRESVGLRDFEGIGPITASLGVAEFIPSEPRDAWLDRADRAMYRAKELGRNRIEVDSARSRALGIDEHLEGSFLKLVWNETYACGHPVIDAQHERLFRLANEILDAVLSDRPIEDLTAIVEALLATVVQHFHDEEEVLSKLGFAGLAEHGKKHAALADKALDLERAFHAGTLSIGGLFQFLAHDVVVLHMLKADREFFPLLADGPR
jgi:diguanylate cyclase (GGDEF)-like protein/hemerythrin-like metal-binding protein